MRVTVLLFASLREISGRDRIELELDDGATLADVRAHVAAQWPATAQVPYVFARNRDYAKAEDAVADGDEIALVPAISGGGEPRFEFTFCDTEIDARDLEAMARSDEDGAVVTFTGVTRNHHDGKGVERLQYEAFEAMAVPKVLAILEEVAAGLEIGRIVVRHRLGEVPIGGASIVVVVAAPHRADAFTAAREVMDRIKREAPIFKKEFFVGEGEAWVGELPG